MTTAGDPDDERCWQVLVAKAGRALGVGTVKDLAEYFRIPVAGPRAAAPDSGLVPVTVEGWGPGSTAGAAWADPQALESLGTRGRHRSPWCRRSTP